MSYAGDCTPEECWKTLSERDDAQLIDVRTSAEWTFVGIPVLESASKKTILIEWQKFPTMEVNEGFVDAALEQLSETGAGKDSPVFMLCRSGARSISAAEALTAAGYTQVFNVLDGFEGGPNEAGQRGQVAGWKAKQLPWRQR